MKLYKSLLQVFERIRLLEKYDALSKKYQATERMLKYSNVEIIILLRNLGCSSNFVSQENLFRVEGLYKKCRLRLNISLKNGEVGLAIYVLDLKDDELIQGGSFASICKRIERERNQRREGYIPSPTFGNYAELKGILEEGLEIFKEFRMEMMSIETVF